VFDNLTYAACVLFGASVLYVTGLVWLAPPRKTDKDE
jgi:hypothetical protein